MNRNTKVIKHSLLPLLMNTDNANAAALRKRNESKVQKRYSQTSSAEAAIICQIAETKDLPLMIEAELRLQENDLEKYAKTPEEKENIQAGLENFRDGLTKYGMLMEHPSTYRKDAPSYFAASATKRLMFRWTVCEGR